MSTLSQFNSKHKVLSIFEEIDDSVPSINMMYGINHLYSDIVGRNRIISSSTKTCVNNSRTIEIAKKVFTYYGLIVPDEDLNINKLFWVSANKRNLYALPKIGSTITLSDIVPDDYRAFWDGGFVNQSAADAGEYILNSPCLCILNKQDFTCSIHGIKYNVDWFNENLSIIIIYVVESEANKIAFYVKPIGIDLLCIDKFDTNYVLEKVIFNNDGKILKEQVESFTSVKDVIILNKKEWALNNMEYLKLRLCRQDRSGRLSYKTIKTVIRTREFPHIRWLVV